MKKSSCHLIIGTGLLAILLSVGHQAVALAETEYDYFGQKPPGIKPEIFAPGIVSSRDNHEFCFTMSADGKEAYFSRDLASEGRPGERVMVTRRVGDEWTVPQPADFFNDLRGFELHLSPIADRVYFSRMLTEDMMHLVPVTEGKSSKIGVWYCDRTDNGWSEPQYCRHGMYVTTTNSGTIYTTDVRIPVGASRMPFIDGKYSELEMIDGAVNSPEPGFHPCIAHDESYIVFDSKRAGGQGGRCDLYVCFKNQDGTWGDAINLGDDVNTGGSDFAATLSPDGKYLFFTSRDDIYWVSTELITRLRPVRE